VNGASGMWPLLFANQFASFQFMREGEPTSSYFPGDTGYVELSFDIDMPLQQIGVRIMVGDDNPVEQATLLAERIDDGQSLYIRYRTDPFHLYHRENLSLSPPEKENILRIPVLDGAVLKAALQDRAEALTIPPVARADIYDNPGQLGALWEDALKRVAQCYRDTVEDYEVYQLKEATRISKLILTANSGSVIETRTKPTDNDIRLLMGDHAAALLIRDEFVERSSSVMGAFFDQSMSLDKARSAIAAVKNNPALGETAFWEDSEAVYLGKGFFYNTETKMPLIDALDENAAAEKLGLTPGQAQAWAAKQVMAASGAHAEKIQTAMSWAMDADDCDIGALLLIAGHRSPPIVASLIPRLVKMRTDPGPPKREYWIADKTAQGFIRGLYVTGAAVRALEGYSEIDTQVGIAVAAIATMGASLGLEAAGYASAAIWANLAGTTADMVLGLYGVQNYLQAEQIYDYAQGAAPAMGDDILVSALADRQSPVMTALGVLLPTAGGASNLKQIRNFKNVNKGRTLMKAKPGVLDDLSALSDTKRTALAGYYTELAGKVKRSGVDKLEAADRAAYEAFTDYFKPQTSKPVPAVAQPASTPDFDEPFNEPGVVKSADLPDTILDPAPGPIAEMDLSATLPPPGAKPATPKSNPDFSDTFNEPSVVKSADLPDTILGPAPGPIAKFDPEATTDLPPGFDPEATVGLPPKDPYETIPPPGYDPDANLLPSGLDPEATVTLLPGNLDETLPPHVLDLEATTDLPPGFDPEATVGPPPKDLSETLPPPGYDPDATQPPPGNKSGEVPPEFGMSPDGKNPLSIKNMEAINNATTPPAPAKPLIIKNDGLTEQLAKLEAAEMTKPGAVPAVQSRVERLREMLSDGTAQELKVALQLDQNLRSLGVSEFDSMAHSSLFYQTGEDGVSGFGQKMIQAQIVAEGVQFYGQRPISLAEFARTTGVSPTAARAAVTAAAKRQHIPYDGGNIVPFSLRH
jgi:hypothetical protein